MRKKALFIINPSAGTRNRKNIPKLIKKYLDPGISYDILYTAFRDHAEELTEKSIRLDHPDYIIAVGGDGTINEVARPLIRNNAVLGILPTGSGNGLARFLNIPLQLKKSIRLINTGRTRRIDVGQINGKIFLCTAGIGFDAHIGKLFSTGNTKGLLGYVQRVIREFYTYQPGTYRIRYQKDKIQQKAFLITLANAGQYGNNAYISPQSSIDDGLLDLCLLDVFPKKAALDLGIRLFNRTIHQNPYYRSVKIRSAVIEMPEHAAYHLDGEHFQSDKSLEVNVIPNGLEVLI